MAVLVTGGAGYIGSHTVLELLEEGYQVVVIDNLSNSSEESLVRVHQITGKKPIFYPIDLMNKKAVDEVFTRHSIDVVIHFAGYKAVGESVAEPFMYYKNNIGSTLVLHEIMQKHGVKDLVFSSSCTVYGEPETIPITEEAPVSAVNPYGRTKLFIEYMLKDFYKADPSLNIALLRYFNPVGAHKSGIIGEDPTGIPNNLMPYISQVAVGKLEKLSVFGSDYPTHDGSGIRDYIHVVDLAIGHIRALEKVRSNSGLVIYNLGTGKGSSVLDMVKAFEEATGIKIPYQVVDRRPGDAAAIWAETTKAEKELGWKAELGVKEMCEDTWRWQSSNPSGYK